MDAHDSTAVVMVDTVGVIRYWSAGASALFGHPDSVGQTLDVIVPAEFRDRHWEGFHRAMASGESPVSGGRLNIPVRCHDGTVRSFPGTFTVLWDGHGRPIGALGSWTERRGDEQPFTAIEA
jgi:PAS domain S-box-containing protein